MKKLKFKLQEWLYRKLRNNIVHRMRANGATWSRINEVLRSLKQLQIIKVEYTDAGPLIAFGELEVVERPAFRKGVPYKAYKYADVEIINPEKAPGRKKLYSHAH